MTRVEQHSVPDKESLVVLSDTGEGSGSCMIVFHLVSYIHKHWYLFPLISASECDRSNHRCSWICDHV